MLTFKLSVDRAGRWILTPASLGPVGLEVLYLIPSLHGGWLCDCGSPVEPVSRGKGIEVFCDRCGAALIECSSLPVVWPSAWGHA